MNISDLLSVNDRRWENDPDVIEDIEMVAALGWHPETLGLPFGPMLLSWGIEDAPEVNGRHEKSGYDHISILKVMSEPERAALRQRLRTGDSRVQMVLHRSPEVAKVRK
jgi:hypothetical protein